jgi:hypothetical protein
VSVDENESFDDILRRLRGVPVVALLGFADEWGEGGNLRLYPEHAYQRWMDIPIDDIRARTQYDEAGRTIVWVDRDSLNEPLFVDGTIDELSEKYAGAPISTWALIPDSRYTAAQMLNLIAPYAGGEEEY